MTADEGGGDKILRRMDAIVTRVANQRMKYQIWARIPSGTVRQITIMVHTEGKKRRRVDILEPGDLKGMGVLILSRTKMYVFIPQLRKARRVATHVHAAGFLGTTFGYHEMAMVTYSDVFRGKLLSQTATHWTVEGTRRKGQTFPYPRLVFVIRKDNQLLERTEYYDGDGTKVKTETRTLYTCRKNGICNPRVHTMVDHIRKGHRTKLVLKEWKTNLKLPERLFSLRSLERRR